MIYTDLTKKAMTIAYNAHMGQINKKEETPYIFHPIHLAEQMDTEEECIVALLHDVVEDTDVEMEDLEKEFSDTVITALKLLTHDKNVDYMEYVTKIKSNPIARKVKLADLSHNMDRTRLKKITEEDIKRIEKYKMARNILLLNSNINT
ncbi:MAG: HD domain-containing protein [Clostridia bacterium]|nr:bifunctional (p)ppGpp synthetase/guanosine-3',5'-bis(diphosphate) 3'-pyrophosphohydrolase [Clostridia bacterium]